MRRSRELAPRNSEPACAWHRRKEAGDGGIALASLRIARVVQRGRPCQSSPLCLGDSSLFFRASILLTNIGPHVCRLRVVGQNTNCTTDFEALPYPGVYVFQFHDRVHSRSDTPAIRQRISRQSANDVWPIRRQSIALHLYSAASAAPRPSAYLPRPWQRTALLPPATATAASTAGTGGSTNTRCLPCLIHPASPPLRSLEARFPYTPYTHHRSAHPIPSRPDVVRPCGRYRSN